MTKLAREFFIKAPIEMNLPIGTILKVNKPLYGIPEAGNHWFGTYHRHHTENLGMNPSTYDPCLMSNDNAVIGLQTDDSLIVATSEFMKKEQFELDKAKLLAKPVEQLSHEHPLNFNGFHITLTDEDRIHLSQSKHISRITLLRENFTKNDYVAQRALGAYVATVSQPEASFSLSYAAQITDPTWKDAQALNACLKQQKAGKALTMVKLDESSLRLITFCDASFANNHDMSSQIGFVIVLADKHDNANIIHWQSVKCRRVTRSVLASELYAFAFAFDTAATLKSTTEQLFPGCRQGIPLIMATDSKSLYDCLTKLGTTKEKRLMIDLMCLRQAYERREITEVIWIKGEMNPADAMTKDKKVCDALTRLIETNKVNVKPESWVDR
jgi:hypothetical protein